MHSIYKIQSLSTRVSYLKIRLQPNTRYFSLEKARNLFFSGLCSSMVIMDRILFVIRMNSMIRRMPLFVLLNMKIHRIIRNVYLNLKDKTSILAKVDHDLSAQLDKEISYCRKIIKKSGCCF